MNRRLTLSALATLMMLADACRAHAGDPGPRITEVRRYYLLDATTLAPLRVQLGERALAAGLVRGAIGRTRQGLGVGYRLDPVASGCVLSAPVVRMDITMDLPAWRPTGTTRRELRARWARMIEALTRHEDGHRDNAVRAATQLQQALSGLGMAPDCKTLGKRAQREIFRAKLRFQLREQAYDRRTGHGVGQGSVL